MGEYADMAVDESLNGYWDDPDDPDDPDGGWFGRSKRRRQRRKLTNAEIFKNHIPPLEDQGF